MTTTRLVAGLAGSLILVSSVGARAQDAQQPAAPSSQSSECSGLGCLFHKDPPQEARQALPPPSVPDPEDPVAGSAKGKGATGRHTVAHGKRTAPDGKSEDVAETKKTKAPVVTIAAEGVELAKVKDLAASLPKKVKVVDAAPGSSKKADFVVTTSADANGKGVAAKLFTEQMHIVAGGSIKSVADLKDKVVSFGPDKSPGQDAARKTFSALNVSVKETPLDVDNALDGLATGDIDAVVVIAPQPVEKLKALSTPGLHLVALPDDQTLPSGVSDTSIHGDLYPNLAKPSETIKAAGVEAILQSAKKARPGAAKAFLSTLSQQAGSLSKRGFDLIKADLEERGRRHFADSAEHR